jgi:hypothetical protein
MKFWFDIDLQTPKHPIILPIASSFFYQTILAYVRSQIYLSEEKTISSGNTSIYLRYEEEIKRSSTHYATDNNELLYQQEEKTYVLFIGNVISASGVDIHLHIDR